MLPGYTRIVNRVELHESMTVVGKGSFRYQVCQSWPTLPDGWDLVEVAGVAVDSRDRVYLFNRGEHPVAIFDLAGNFIASWGEEVITRAHGLTIGPDDSVYCVDDADHTVKKFSPDGRILLTLGTSGKFSDTGATTLDYRTIERSAPPFNFPCNLALGHDGEMYIADGYGNARVHKFSPDGKLLRSWGRPGNAPGEFHIPHGIAVDRNGLVHVADRENCRIQQFTPEGDYVGEWTNIARPCQVLVLDSGAICVAELGYRAGMWPGTTAPTQDATGGRVSVFTETGDLLARWGGGDDPCAPGDFFAPHDLCVDSHGDLYVSEVCWSGGGKRGLVPRSCHPIQKFEKHDL